MKKIVLLIIIFLELFLIKIPKYVELNNLAIIEKIGIEKNNNKYTIMLKEIIPQKNDQGFSYKYIYHKSTASSLNKAYEKIQHNTKKKLFLAKAKSLFTNIKNTKDITNFLKISPKKITYINKNVFNYIKE